MSGEPRGSKWSGLFTFSMILSLWLGESLPLWGFASPYDTGAWTTLLGICLYFYILFDLELNTWLVSKEKKFSRLGEEEIMALMMNFSLYIKRNAIRTQKQQLLDQIELLNQYQPNVVYSNDVELRTTHKFKSSAFGIHYYTNDQRAFNFLNWVVNMIS